MLEKNEREALMTITNDLHNYPMVVMDLLPRLNHVLLQSDITRVEYRGNKAGWEWAANDLLMFYTQRAINLEAMMVALDAVKMEKLTAKISCSLNSKSASASNDTGEEEFQRIMAEMRDYVRSKYLTDYAKLRPMPQIKRLFDIKKIWVNLQFENREELKLPVDYQDCMLAAFQENRLLVVKGDQGSGKTTSLRRVAVDWASGDLTQFQLVLMARYRDLKNDATTVLDMVLEWMTDKQYLTSQHATFLRSNREKLSPDVEGGAKILLLIDGLEETTSKCKELDKAFRSQEAFGFSYYVLITSRPEIVTQKVRCPVPIAFILPWSLKYRLKYIDAHFPLEATSLDFSTQQQNRNAVVDFLAAHPDVEQQVVQVPLHLCFVCLLKEDGELEPGMSASEFHRRLCYALVRRQALLSSDDTSVNYRELTEAFDSETPFGCATECTVMRNLALLAYDGLLGVGVSSAFRCKQLKDRKVDKDICLNVGFLRTDEDDTGQSTKYQFLHSSLQYYFTADLLLEEFRKMPELKVVSIEDGTTLANEDVMKESEILHHMWHSTKCIDSLAPMVSYLIEMALENHSAQESVINSITAFLLSWNFRWSRQSIPNIDFPTVVLLLRLAKESVYDSKLISNEIIEAMVLDAGLKVSLSLLDIIDEPSLLRIHLPDDRVDLHGLFYESNGAVYFSLQPITTSSPLEEFSGSIEDISLCLMERGTFSFLPHICQRLACKRIRSVQALIDNSDLQPPIYYHGGSESVTEITSLSLNFSNLGHSIEIAPFFQNILSYAKISVKLALCNASISDLSAAFAYKELTYSLERISLTAISFTDAEKCGSILSSLQHLKTLRLVVVTNRECGPDFLNFLSKLKLSTSCNYLQLHAIFCLENEYIFRRLCRLLSGWPHLKKLSLNSNKFQEAQINELVRVTKKMPKLALLSLQHVPNVRMKHIDAIKRCNQNLDVLTY